MSENFHIGGTPLRLTQEDQMDYLCQTQSASGAIFTGFTPHENEFLLNHTEFRKYSKGEYIIKQKSEVDFLAVIAAGVVGLYQDQRQVGACSTGKLVGEVPVFSPVKGSVADVVAKSTVITIHFKRAELSVINEMMPDVGFKILQICGRAAKVKLETLLSSCLGEENLQPVRSKVILERKPSLIAAMHTRQCFGSGASLAELKCFTDIITLSAFKTGEQILLKGQKARCFILILEGSIVNRVDGPSSRVISTQGAGDWVGLEDLFCTFGVNGKAVRTTSAYGKGDVMLGIVPIKAFQELSRDEPNISWMILRHLVRICVNFLSKRPPTFGIEEPESSPPEPCLDELLKSTSNAFDSEECCRMLFAMSAMCPCWRGFESGDFRVLNKHMTMHCLEKGTYLVRKGECASFFALVLEGELTSRSPDGTCIPVMLGSIIGQNALFIGGYRQIDVWAAEKCTVAIIRYETLIHFNLSNPDLGSKVMQLLASSSYILTSKICLGTTEMDRLNMHTEYYLDSLSAQHRFETEMKVRKAHLPCEMGAEEMLETWPDIKVLYVRSGGDVLIKGQESTCALYLVEGTVTVFADGKGSQEICDIGPGNYLGALALLQDPALPTERRTADVYAKSDVILAVLSYDTLAELNYMDPITGYATFKSLIQGTIRSLACSVDAVRRRKMQKATELLIGKRQSCLHKLSNKARAMKMVIAGGQEKEAHSSEMGEGKAKGRAKRSSTVKVVNNNDLEDPSDHKPEEISDLGAHKLPFKLTPACRLACLIAIWRCVGCPLDAFHPSTHQPSVPCCRSQWLREGQ